MTNKQQNFETPVESGSATYLQRASYEILHSEHRDENVKGKFYGYIHFYDKYGNGDGYSTTDNVNTKEEAINEIRNQLKSYYSKVIFKDIAEIN